VPETEVRSGGSDLCELFDTRFRYSGVSIVHQISGIVSSSITPLISALLQQARQRTTMVDRGVCVYRWGRQRPSTYFIRRTF